MPKLTDPTENAERTFQISVASSKFNVDGAVPTANTVMLEKEKLISLTNQILLTTLTL